MECGKSRRFLSQKLFFRTRLIFILLILYKENVNSAVLKTHTYLQRSIWYRFCSGDHIGPFFFQNEDAESITVTKTPQQPENCYFMFALRRFGLGRALVQVA